MPRVKCTHVASKLCTQRVFILFASNLCHQPVMCMLAHSKDFCTRVVRALLHTRVFVKFKLSCTIGNAVLAVYIIVNGILAVVQY